MPRHLMFVLLVVIAVGYAVPLGHSEVVGVKRVLTQMPVTGRLEHGGTFAGRLTVEELTVNDLGQLAATGVLVGTATSETGNATPIPPRTVITQGIVTRSAWHLHHFGTGCWADIPGAAGARGDAGSQSPWTCTLCQRTSTSWALPCVPWRASRKSDKGAEAEATGGVSRNPMDISGIAEAPGDQCSRPWRRCRACCTTRRTSSA